MGCCPALYILTGQRSAIFIWSIVSIVDSMLSTLQALANRSFDLLGQHITHLLWVWKQSLSFLLGLPCSPSRALSSLNLKKKRDCSQSTFLLSGDSVYRESKSFAQRDKDVDCPWKAPNTSALIIDQKSRRN